jgi:MoxR-like ATPase
LPAPATRAACCAWCRARWKTALAARLAAERDSADTALGQLQARLDGRLWLPPELAARWTDAHRLTRDTAQALIDRLQPVRAGFAALKVDERLPAEAPEVPRVPEAPRAAVAAG